AAGDAATPEPPPMTAAEKNSIESIRRIMARLKGEAWAYTVSGMERYVGAVENGVQLPIARPKARELLANLETLAALAEGLDASKAAYPEYVQMRQKQLEPVFLGMMDAESRPAAYARLDAMWKDDEFRRQVDAGGLPPASAQGLMRAFYDVVPRLLRDATDGAAPQGQAIRAACLAVAGLFEKATAGPPKDMTPALRDGYLRLQKDFRSEVEAAGAALPADTAGGVAKLTAAAGAAHGMDLLVRTDAALKAIAKHKVSRGQTLIAQALRLAQDMAIKQGAEAAAAAQTLELFIQSFEELGRFPMPEQDLARTVNALVGRAYGPASTALNQALGAGLDAAAGGDPVPLRQALAAQNMFGLLRRRAQAAAYHLDKAPTTNLATFSVPENVWSKFVPTLDKKMQEAFAQYGSQGATRAPYIAAMAEWDYVYADVIAGVRMTQDGRLEGEADLDLLMRNLERATLASPDRQAANLWAVGYHATEAAVSLAAGFDTVAAWHRNLMRGCDAALRTVDLAPAKREGRR
ncbi:MAG: hypothetical protein NT049_08260, partial [Planctomycetota bacterium]|nr:hypothetical protein [Planctomycetota bacterium]